MNYLKNYNLSDKQIKNVAKVIKQREINVDTFKYNREKKLVFWIYLH